uniref:Uncharacterized protein n=1 Tax=Branchiostoma floridae TaxID=7739 RepID=C3Y9N5_BRAFL|eukprot:XP_002607281.1 hypothetical protein BRAFLDRAFT_88229 [Branchiostoma floridae]
MKFYTFNGAALALMERSLREGTDPDESEICRVDPTFPNKSKLSRTGRVQKWREIKSKLVLGEDFVAHCDAPNLGLPAREDIERIFQDSHLTTHPESLIHRSWRETWKSISSVYQTNVKKFGITRECFKQHLDTCSCNVGVVLEEPQTSQTTTVGNDDIANVCESEDDEFVGFQDESDSDSEDSEDEIYDLFQEMNISAGDPNAGSTQDPAQSVAMTTRTASSPGTP